MKSTVHIFSHHSRLLDEYEWPAKEGKLSDLDIVLIVVGVIILFVGVWSIRAKMMADKEHDDIDGYRRQSEDEDEEDTD